MTIEIRRAKGFDFELESGCELRTSGLVRVSLTIYFGIRAGAGARLDNQWPPFILSGFTKGENQ
jgi:hypothetical protein